ncbi:hypothetical protein JH146_0249 [Methanocaldococcus bathoardescens]|uniref:DUF2254 domain-containing protein n=1 Tax=Methanocaldococcus bathoardescens TaxID=1301915 RepID=A0A076L9V5_9EURY|nr:DUF2254 family protein [Methanocaldococcus bathoardescens]AIJ05100.1 hypothetical protein JH146_0249 [Methanocaldococcus bathoardescens]
MDLLRIIEKFKEEEIFNIIFISGIAVILTIISIHCFSWDEGFTDNVRYILSALLQTQAGMIGIIVSITIIAIQMVSQQYSTRIGHIILNKTFWAFILSYLISMGYEVFALGFLPVKKDIVVVNFLIPYNFLVALVFFFAYFDFLIVIPYIKSTIYNLRPEVVIEKLIKSIDRKEIENYKVVNSEYVNYKSAKDIPRNPLRTVYYIIEKALNLQHYMTVRNAMILLGSYYEELNAKTKNQDERFFRIYIDIIIRIACLANNSPISITREAMISLKKIITYELSNNVNRAIYALKGIGKIVLANINAEDKSRIKIVVLYALKNLNKISEELLTKSPNDKIYKFFDELLNILEEIIKGSIKTLDKDDFVKVFKKSLDIVLLAQEYANINGENYMERVKKTVKNIGDLLKSYGYDDLIKSLKIVES